MKVIFLDIDGVLNSKKFFKSDYTYAAPDDSLDPYAIKKLNKIVDKTGAEIVVSSTWRIGKSVDDLENILNRNGFTGHVIDKTEDLIHERKTRGDEIKKWLDEHLNIDSFVIIDDFNFPKFEKYFSTRFVQTDDRVGLSNQDADKCVDILQTNYKE